MSESDKMQIFVKLESHCTVTLHVLPQDTVFDIKAKLQSKKIVMKEKINLESKLLTFGGRNLEDDRRLSDYNIQRESTLQSLDRLHGGFPDAYYFTMIIFGTFMLIFMDIYFLAAYAHHADA